MRLVGVALILSTVCLAQSAPWTHDALIQKSARVVLARAESAKSISAVVHVSRFAVLKTFKGSETSELLVGDLGTTGTPPPGSAILLFLKPGSSGYVHAALHCIVLDPAQVLPATVFLEQQMELAEMNAGSHRDRLLKKRSLEGLNSTVGLQRRAALHDLAALALKRELEFNADDLAAVEAARVSEDLQSLRSSLLALVLGRIFQGGGDILREEGARAQQTVLARNLQQLRSAQEAQRALAGILSKPEAHHQRLLRLLLLDERAALRTAALRVMLNQWHEDPPMELRSFPPDLSAEELCLRVEVVGRCGGPAEFPWLRERVSDQRCREQALTAIARLGTAEGLDFLRQLSDRARGDSALRKEGELIAQLLSEEFRKAEALRRAGMRRY
jgi:hypothetical protein